MFPKIKNILIFVIIGICFVLVYFFFIKNNKEDDQLLTDTLPISTSNTTNTKTEGVNTVLSQEILSILLGIRSITLEDNIFNKTSFKELKDRSIILLPEGGSNKGRSNPFAPIGQDLTDSSSFMNIENATPSDNSASILGSLENMANTNKENTSTPPLTSTNTTTKPTTMTTTTTTTNTTKPETSTNTTNVQDVKN